MKQYRLTRRSDRDLFEILLYGINQFGRAQSEAYSGRLLSCFQLLAANPLIGRSSPVIGEGVRRHEHGSHIILYEVIPDGVLILAVVHRRNVRRLVDVKRPD